MSTPVSPAHAAATPADVATKTSEATTENGNPVTADNPTPAQETDWKAKYEETISESRKWEARAKENREAAARLAELEEAQKTAEQKQAEELERLRKENETFKHEREVAAWKKQVSEETGVPAEALAGNSLEELQAHAEVLKPLISAPKAPQLAPVSTPLGNEPSSESANIPISQQIALAEKEGNWALAGQLKAIQLGQSAK